MESGTRNPLFKSWNCITEPALEEDKLTGVATTDVVLTPSGKDGRDAW